MSLPVQEEEELVVTACPPGYTGYYPECKAPTTGGSDPPPTTGGDDGGLPPGGGGSDPCYGCEPDYDPEKVEADSRSAPYDETGEVLDCPKAEKYGSSNFDQAHCDRIQAATDFLKNHPGVTPSGKQLTQYELDKCKQFGRSADYHFSSGKSYHYWTSADPGVYGGMGAGGSLGLTPLAFNTGQTANTVAHEESHRAGYPDYTDKATGKRNKPHADGYYAGDWGKLCASPTL
jgi:hypothetical protein